MGHLVGILFLDVTLSAQETKAGLEWRDLLVVGGRQNRNALHKEEWHRFRQGVVVCVPGSGSEPKVRLEYESPPTACAHEDQPSILFKAGSLADGRLYLCTQTEILVVDLETFETVHYLSLPFFNDLHHVRPTERNTLLVTVTGLDMVVEVEPNGAVVREWGVLGQSPWERFSRDIDYRRIVTTKPHHSHPNYVFVPDGDIWVTRFEQKDAVCLTTNVATIPIDVEKPHDGIVFDGQIYFTTVDGHVVIADADSKQVLEILDLNEMSGSLHALGWCRGLAVLTEHLIVVGFSRIRPTRFRENLRWVRYGLGLREDKGDLPTRIVCYDLGARREAWAVDLEGCGMNAVFSIHPVPRTLQ
ncbi:MAG: hypothetical protein ACREMD_08790 [Gemmatimonadota bacterium]